MQSLFASRFKPLNVMCRRRVFIPRALMGVEHASVVMQAQAPVSFKRVSINTSVAPPLMFLQVGNNAQTSTQQPPTSYKGLVDLVEAKKVDSVEFTKHDMHVKVITKNDETFVIDVPESKQSELARRLIKNDVDITYKENEFLTMSMYVLEYLVMGWVLYFVFLIVTQRRGGGGAGAFASFTEANPLEGIQTNVTFEDVAGLKHAKQDLKEVVDFLKSPEKYNKLGAKVPKGVLLVGGPGVGKTLLAKAVAGEAGVPFFSVSASEMIQMFVGVGAARVRSLFEKAGKKAPSIIFIDELDAIARSRSAANMPGNDERDQTINQLLTEMDGFKERNVIVLAATNRVDVLDAAVLRPGRFDRQVNVDVPDFKDRVDILRVHTRNKPLAEDVDLGAIAKMTTGYSGADLANVANEAAILAARGSQEVITLANFYSAIDKIMMGEVRDIIVSDEKKLLTAYHEAGHALVALKTGLYENVRTVSIIPRGKTGGVTIFEQKDDHVDSGLVSRQHLEDQIAVALGGRIAEEIVFGAQNITTGASSDITQVYNIAKHMVTHYGLSKKLGAIAWHHVSDKTQFEVEQEIRDIVEKIYDRTKRLLVANKGVLDSIAKQLFAQEVMSGEELKKLVS